MDANEVVKPEGIAEERLQSALAFLDDLRETGVTNMYGAVPYIEEWHDDEYGEKISRHVAKAVLVYWMKTFSARHSKA